MSAVGRTAARSERETKGWREREELQQRQRVSMLACVDDTASGGQDCSRGIKVQRPPVGLLLCIRTANSGSTSDEERSSQFLRSSFVSFKFPGRQTASDNRYLTSNKPPSAFHLHPSARLRRLIRTTGLQKNRIPFAPLTLKLLISEVLLHRL